MNRRAFLIGSISLLLSNHAIAKVNIGKTFDVYIDESGNKGTNDPLVIGALVLDSNYNYQRLDKIREKAKFKQVLRYNSSNRYKKLLSVPFIKEFFTSEKMSFTSVVIPAAMNTQWPSNKMHRTSLYHHNYIEFIKLINKKGIRMNIFLEKRSTTGEDMYLKSFIEEHNFQVHVRFIKEKESNCLQLSDLFTGSVYGELTGVKNKAKAEIINDIKRHLNVSRIAKNINLNKGKFLVRIADHI